ncbi:MAG: hypothetical protein WD226_03960 [Planctomycetota bacterium]
MKRFTHRTLTLGQRSITARFGEGADERAVVVVGGPDVELEDWLAPLDLQLVVPDLAGHFGGDFEVWPDREALRLLDDLADRLVAEHAIAADSIALVGVGAAAPLAWLGGCTSTRFAVIGSLGAPPVYDQLSRAKPMQPVEMTLNLDRALLAAFPAEAAHLEVVRDQLESGSKDFSWVPFDGTTPMALAKFLDERL